jgi:phage-related protein
MAQKPSRTEPKEATEKEDLEPIPVAFWRTGKGKEPVREWLKEMPKADRTKIGEDLATLQYGWPVGMPLCRSMKNGLWELRSELSSSRQVRILLTFFEGRVVLLHGFMKKTQKTPKDDLDLAIKRKRTLA